MSDRHGRIVYQRAAFDAAEEASRQAGKHPIPPEVDAKTESFFRSQMKMLGESIEGVYRTEYQTVRRSAGEKLSADEIMMKTLGRFANASSNEEREKQALRLAGVCLRTVRELRNLERKK